MNNWKKIKLGDIALEIRDSYEPFKDENFDYIGLEHIAQQNLQILSVGKSSDTESIKMKFESGDILFGKLRPYFRKVIKPKFSGVCSSEISVIRPKGSNDRNFLFYFLANPDFIDLISKGTSGTRMPRAKWDVISEMQFYIPREEEQYKIGSILIKYDDLIEINNKRIKIMEEMAQLIYKEWFVKFKFSGHEKVKIKNGVPEGWVEVRIEEVVDNIKQKYQDDKHSQLPLLDLARIPRKSLAISDYGLNDEIKTARKIFNTYDVLFGNIRVYFHKVVFAMKSGITNSSVFVFRTKNPIYQNFFFNYFFSDDVVAWAVQNSGGMKMPTIAWDVFKMKKLILPDEKIIKEYNKIVQPMTDLIINLNLQNENLRKTRDILLPKLMSGEIEV